MLQTHPIRSHPYDQHRHLSYVELGKLAPTPHVCVHVCVWGHSPSDFGRALSEYQTTFRPWSVRELEYDCRIYLDLRTLILEYMPSYVVPCQSTPSHHYPPGRRSAVQTAP